jgi:hypothetical protein
MAYKVFVAGEEALASDVNGYLMSQTVPRFTNATQRTSQLTAPVLNQLSILDSRPGVVQYWNGSAWVDAAPLVQAGNSVLTTNVSGIFTVGFPIPFAAIPVASITNGDNSSGVHVYAIYGVGSTNAQLSALVSTVNAVPVANAAVRVHWIAVGAK